jgi:hypothetical protein
MTFLTIVSSHGGWMDVLTVVRFRCGVEAFFGELYLRCLLSRGLFEFHRCRAFLLLVDMCPTRRDYDSGHETVGTTRHQER